MRKTEKLSSLPLITNNNTKVEPPQRSLTKRPTMVNNFQYLPKKATASVLYKKPTENIINKSISSFGSDSSSVSDSIHENNNKMTKGQLIDVLNSFKNKIVNDYVYNDNNLMNYDLPDKKNSKKYGPFSKNEFISIISDDYEKKEVLAEKQKKLEEETFRKNFVVILNYYYHTNPEMYRTLSHEYNHRMHNYILNRIKLPAIFEEKIKYASDEIYKSQINSQSSEQLNKMKSTSISLESKKSARPTLFFRQSTATKASSRSSVTEDINSFEMSPQEIIWISEKNFVNENILNSFVFYLNEKVKSEQNRNSAFAKYKTVVLPTFYYKEMLEKKKKYGGMTNHLGDIIIPEKYQNIKNAYDHILCVISLGSSEFIIVFFNFIKNEINILDASSRSNDINYYRDYIQNYILFLDLQGKIRTLEKKNGKINKVILKTAKTENYKESALYTCFFLYSIITQVQPALETEYVEIEVFRRKFIQLCEQLQITKNNWGSIPHFAFFPL